MLGAEELAQTLKVLMDTALKKQVARKESYLFEDLRGDFTNPRAPFIPYIAKWWRSSHAVFPTEGPALLEPSGMPIAVLEETPEILALATKNGGLVMDHASLLTVLDLGPPKSVPGFLVQKVPSRST